MNQKTIGSILFLTCLLGSVMGVQSKCWGDNLNFVIMVSKNPETESPKYAALADYLKLHLENIDNIKLQTAADYPAAVGMFKSGEVDGMFSGSFVAAIFIKKGVAVPVVRPVTKEGVSMYKALIIAQEGKPEIKNFRDLDGKKIAYCALASSGEVFIRGLIKGDKPEDHYTPMIMKSHGVAVKAVMSGDADVAVVKDLVYGDGVDFPGTIIVGADSAGNPNNTLIMRPTIYEKYGQSIEEALSAVENDDSPAAVALKNVFNIKGFVKTNDNDFVHTFENLKKAKINAVNFNFKWEN